MGLRYTGFRIYHEFEKRSGRLKKKHPTSPDHKVFIPLEKWRSTHKNVLIPNEGINGNQLPNDELESKTKKILEGDVLFFCSEWRSLGKDYDWVTNPDTGYRYDTKAHWSQINDFDPKFGDIKYVWEKSRFSWLLTLMRYDYHFEEDHSEFVWDQIEDWIDKNPINQGPNWKCSQEISLRLFNWVYALEFYRDSEHLTDSRWAKIQNVIFWSLHHVYQNINFSRIAVRNNHAITETLCLTLSELFFPFIPQTKIWALEGRKWFEQEIAYQIYEDGTFLQFSMNYHRVVIQLLSLGISVTERHGESFSSIVYKRAYNSLDFLYQCLQEENGHLPNYGNNDGALFFPLTDTDFRDFRPQLNTLHRMLTGTFLYSEKNLQEDFIKGSSSNSPFNFSTIKKRFGALSFPKGGFFVLREEKTFIFIRCGNHKDRPAQADNLHVDIWCQGNNVLRDSGTFKYNTEKKYQEYFMGTASHNTVTINGLAQMLKGDRFIWFYWTQAKIGEWQETHDTYIFKGSISAFRHLGRNILHSRTLIKKKNETVIEIQDEIEGIEGSNALQQWHMGEGMSEEDFISSIEGREVEPIMIESYDSTYYGRMKKGKGIAFPFSKIINTTINLR